MDRAEAMKAFQKKSSRKSDGKLRFVKFARVLAPGLALLVLFTIAIILDGPARAASPATEQPATLSMQGDGKIFVAPDMANFTLTVIKQNESAEKALAENNEAITSIIALLKSEGVEQKHLQTRGFQIQPEYARYKPKSDGLQQPPKIVGYRVNNGLSVQIHDMEKLGKILTSVVEAGTSRLGAIHFDVSNREELLDKARAKAYADAKRKADIYMTAAGTSLGPIISMSEQMHHVTPQFAALEETAILSSARSAPVPIAGGESVVSITVHVTWEIQQ